MAFVTCSCTAFWALAGTAFGAQLMETEIVLFPPCSPLPQHSRLILIHLLSAPIRP